MQITKQFVIAGNAKFTVSHGNTKFAYQVKSTGRDAGANRQGMFLVYTFADNGRRLYVGRLNSQTGLVTIGRRSKVGATRLLFQVIQWTCNVLWLGNAFPPGYQVETVGRCGRCGRKLANPRLLFGPECQSERSYRAYRDRPHTWTSIR